MNQTTIRQAFSCSGIGLHSGSQVHLRVEPAPAGSGLVFEVPTADGITRITPRPDAVTATGLATTLGSGQARIATVEHFLGAVRGLGIDNLLVRVEGGEVPILDGSAAEWVRLFSQAGVQQQKAPRRVLSLVHPIELRDGDKYIRAVPHTGFSVDCTIDFPHPSIGRQHIRLDITPETFPRIARARTFGFLEQVEYLRSKGLARGGSLDNAVVLGPQGVINEGGLRFEDEFVRHKVLDFVGDMAMLPLPLQGHFELCCAGHELHNKFVRKLVETGALIETEERASAGAQRPVRSGATRGAAQNAARGAAWSAA